MQSSTRVKWLAAAAIGAAASMLGGCAAVLLGGAAAGVAVSEDRRTVGTQTDDKGIELKVGSRVGERVKDGHINSTCYNRMVLLTGEVPSSAARDEAERAARSVENVRGVFNELRLATNSGIAERTNDALITSNVKARMADGSGRVNPLHVKVTTEGNAVYLMGLLTRAEADGATSIARTTRGVQRVVRLFEYLD